MNNIFATHKHSWNFEYKWVNNIEIECPSSLVGSVLDY